MTVEDFVMTIEDFVRPFADGTGLIFIALIFVAFILIRFYYLENSGTMAPLKIMCLMVGVFLLITKHEWWVYGAGLFLYGLVFIAELMANGVGVLFEGFGSSFRRRRRSAFF